nr:hypothetical protein [Tanacetum cinerariifolium]
GAYKTKVKSKKQKSATVGPARTVPSKKGNRLLLTREPTTCVEALENVIEDEPHFITKIIDNDLRALTMITKHFATKRSIDSNEGRGGLVVLRGKSLRELKNGCGEVGGVEKISSIGSKFMANWEDCLDGCDKAGGGEVKGGGVYFGVLKSSSGEIPGETMG